MCWIGWIRSANRCIRRRRKSPARNPARPAPSREMLFYVLYSAWNNGRDWSVRFVKARRDEQGMPTGAPTDWNNVERALIQPPRFISEEDLVILRLLWSHRSKARYTLDFPLRGRAGEETLNYMLASGRLLADQHGMQPFAAGEAAWRKPDLALRAGWQRAAGVAVGTRDRCHHAAGRHLVSGQRTHARSAAADSISRPARWRASSPCRR
jgi:hypothetical protein